MEKITPGNWNQLVRVMKAEIQKAVKTSMDEYKEDLKAVKEVQQTLKQDLATVDTRSKNTEENVSAVTAELQSCKFQLKQVIDITIK